MQDILMDPCILSEARAMCIYKGGTGGRSGKALEAQ